MWIVVPKDARVALRAELPVVGRVAGITFYLGDHPVLDLHLDPTAVQIHLARALDRVGLFGSELRRHSFPPLADWNTGRFTSTDLLAKRARLRPRRLPTSRRRTVRTWRRHHRD